MAGMDVHTKAAWMHGLSEQEISIIMAIGDRLLERAAGIPGKETLPEPCGKWDAEY